MVLCGGRRGRLGFVLLLGFALIILGTILRHHYDWNINLSRAVTSLKGTVDGLNNTLIAALLRNNELEKQIVEQTINPLIKNSAPDKTLYVKIQAPKHNETNVYRWKGGKWFRIPGFCSQTGDLNSAELRSKVGAMKMYIHDVRKDVHVSGSIKRSGMWDLPGVNVMIRMLQENPDMGVLDIGSQLGTFSLVAAMMGRHVVAVDPLVENVIRFCKSVQDSRMTDRVTILFTAVSDKYDVVAFNTPGNNIGGTKIRSVGKDGGIPKGDYDPKLISTILLDDILAFIDFKKAFMKIDVENHEYHALREGNKVFDAVDIRAILMEWFQIKHTDGAVLKEFLKGKKFQAAEPNRRGILSQTDIKLWPNDILWLKK